MFYLQFSQPFTRRKDCVSVQARAPRTAVLHKTYNPSLNFACHFLSKGAFWIPASAGMTADDGMTIETGMTTVDAGMMVEEEMMSDGKNKTDNY